jgi:hypothetical protein
MTARERVGRYKGGITLYGRVDTRRLLPHGPEDTIWSEVRRLKALFGNGGGLIMTGSQGLLPDIPYANAVAMLEENQCTTNRPSHRC